MDVNTPSIRLAGLTTSELLVDRGSLSFSDDVIVPACNHLLIRPYSAIASATGAAGLELPIVKPLTSTVVTPFTPKWFVQSTVTAVSTAAVYLVAQQVFSGSMRGFGLHPGRTSSLLAGATCYEYLRAPATGETRLSNSASTLAMLAAFETVNSMTGPRSGIGLQLTRFAAGSAGSTAAMLTNSLLGNENSRDVLSHLWTGGVINVLLSHALIGSRGSMRSLEKASEPAKVSTMEAVSSKIGPSPIKPPKLLEMRLVQSDRTERISVIHGVEASNFRDFNDFLMRGQAFRFTEMSTYKANETGLTILVPTTSPSYLRISPQELFEILRAVPDVRLFSKVKVLDWPNRMEPWYRQQHQSAVIHGETTMEGEVDLFKPVKGIELEHTVFHEWSHLHAKTSPHLNLFLKALDIEPLNVLSRSHTIHSTVASESWPILGEDLLVSGSQNAKLTAFLNPVKSSIWAMDLTIRLESLPPHLRGSGHQTSVELCRFIDAQIRPSAIRNLEQMAPNPSIEELLNALRPK